MAAHSILNFLLTNLFIFLLIILLGIVINLYIAVRWTVLKKMLGHNMIQCFFYLHMMSFMSLTSAAKIHLLLTAVALNQWKL